MGYRYTLFLLITLLLSFSSSLSRVLPPPYSVLDVSASLQRAQEILSFDPEAFKPFDDQEALTATPVSNSSFSLPLLPRHTVYPLRHTDYKTLVLYRLARDSDRVNSLNTKLQLAIHHLRKADLKPLETEIQPEDLSTPVVSGAGQGSGEYFSRVGVGSPPKPFYMVLDTGSDINWLQCEPCSECYQQSDPIFNPSASSSYRTLPCESPQCSSLDVSSCRAGRCLYQVSYGDGSYTVGDFVTESVSFGNTGSKNDVALGCGHDNEGLFVGAAGLLGLGGGSLSLPSQIKATSFSYCLVDRDSSKSSSLEFNSLEPADSVIAPMLKNGKVNTFYYVGLAGFNVGGHPVSIPSSLFQVDESGDGGIIVDSGTAITRLQTDAYNTLRDSFVSMTQHLKKAAGVALFDTCYDLSSVNSVKVPTVSFRFGSGKTLDLPAKNYLIPVDSSGTFCFAFAPTSSSMSIIGNVQQQGTRVTFNIANSRVGFSPNKC